MTADNENKLFEDWYKENERRHYCGHFDDKQIARSGFYAGLEYASTKAEEELEKFMTTLDIKEDRKVIRKLRRYIIQYKQQ